MRRTVCSLCRHGARRPRTGTSEHRKVFLQCADVRDPRRFQCVDTRWVESLGRGYGSAEFRAARLPGAALCKFERDGCGVVTERSGTHPLPHLEDFADWIRDAGLQPDGKPVLLYDDLGGAVPAARLWWMLRAVGWEQVYILDGGWHGWHQEGFGDLVDTGPVEKTEPLKDDARVVFIDSWVDARMPVASFRDMCDLSKECSEQSTTHNKGGKVIIDARALFRWDTCSRAVSPDLKPGRIPSSICQPWYSVMDPGVVKKLIPALEVDAKMTVMKNRRGEEVTVYCGNGVHSCYLVAACEHFGFGTPRLYPGGLTEWVKRGQETELGNGRT